MGPHFLAVRGSLRLPSSAAAAPPLPRSGGSYVFAALNLSNWNGIAKAALLRVSAHVAFVTEHKLLAAPLRIARRWMTTKGWSVFSSPDARTEAGGISGGVMITVRREVVAHPVPPHVWESLSFDPVTRSRLTACIVHIGVVVVLAVAVYLFDSDNLSERNVALLEQVAVMRQVLALPLLVGGDFNMSRTSLLEARFPERNNLILPQSPQHTCTVGHGAELDYVFLPSFLAASKASATVVPVGLPHHHAVIVALHSVGRPCFRTFYRPAPLPPVSVHSEARWAEAKLEAAAACGLPPLVWGQVHLLTPSQFLPLLSSAAELYALHSSLIDRAFWRPHTGRGGFVSIINKQFRPCRSQCVKTHNSVRFLSGLLRTLQSGRMLINAAQERSAT